MHILPTRFLWLVTAIACMAMLASTVRAASPRPSFQTPYVTRAESVMLLLQARIPRVPALVSSGEFSDVPRGAWYERYMVIADRLAILQPNAINRRIRPEDPVTRAEFLSIAARTFGINADGTAQTYLDVSPEAWYADVAGMAQRLRLFSADPDQMLLHPEEFMIHGEAARAVQLLTDAGPAADRVPRPARQSLPDAKISTRSQSVAVVKPRGPVPSSGQPPPASIDPARAATLRGEILGLVNAARTHAGVAPLLRSAELEMSGQKYAEAMASRNFFGHVSPSGETLKDRMGQSGYYKAFFHSDCLCVARYMLGENLARGQKTPKETVDDWLRSPSHRATMLNADFTDTGFGISAGVWVEHFGGKQK